MRDDDQAAPTSGAASSDGEYRPSGAIAVTVILAGTIVLLWGFVYILSLVRS